MRRDEPNVRRIFEGGSDANELIVDEYTLDLPNSQSLPREILGQG